jgi:ubiquinone biosynthesis protein UbiJ
MTDPDLNFLARQVERLINDVGSLRDDMRVLTAMVLRQDHTLARLVEEVRAVHEQISRMNDRIRKLEDAAP